ncbi:hypothetical protein AAU61_09905 [Desulfocarbo indianensis]|nr:hypothetical protein AAU61_09905 [Desulfocarbo indianensis]
MIMRFVLAECKDWDMSFNPCTSLDFIKPIWNQIVCFSWSILFCQLKHETPRVALLIPSFSQCVQSIGQRDIFPDRMTLISMYSSLPLFQINRVIGEVPMDY